jgi:hypothetical protein
VSDRLTPLLRHAVRFGTEGVYEAAGGLCEDDRLRLRIELDAIDREQRGRRTRVRAGGKAEATRGAVLLLAADGLISKAIGVKLHISDRTVRRYLADRNGSGAVSPKSAPQKRMVERHPWPKEQNAGSDMSEVAEA